MKRVLSCFAFAACVAVATTAQAGVDSEFELGISSNGASARSSGGNADGSALLGDVSHGDITEERSATTRSDDLDVLSGGSAPVAPRRSHVPSWQSLLPGSIQ